MTEFDPRRELAEATAPDYSWHMGQIAELDEMNSSGTIDAPPSPYTTATKEPGYTYPDCQAEPHWFGYCNAERADEHNPATPEPHWDLADHI